MSIIEKESLAKEGDPCLHNCSGILWFGRFDTTLVLECTGEVKHIARISTVEEETARSNGRFSS